MDRLVATGIVPYIIEFINNYLCKASATLLIECSWILTNISSGEYVKLLVENGIIQTTLNLFDSCYHEEILANAVWMLSNIAGDSVEYRDELIKVGIVDKLLDVMDGQAFQPQFVSYVCWLISNLCSRKPLPPYYKVALSAPNI